MPKQHQPRKTVTWVELEGEKKKKMQKKTAHLGRATWVRGLGATWRLGRAT